MDEIGTKGTAGPAETERRGGALSVLVLTVMIVPAHVIEERRLHTAVRGVQLWSIDSAVTIGLAISALLLPAKTPSAVRALVLAVLGAVLVGEGGSHLSRIAAGDAARSDLIGVLVAMGGAAVLVVAVLETFRHNNARSGLRRWSVRLVGSVFLLLVGTFLVLPVTVGTVQTHLPRRTVAPPPSARFDDVTLRTADGLKLRAWYHPSTNGAAVMVLNSARGDHRASAAHARLLAGHGYGVLVYDARGTGGSEGAPNGWGWTWLPDVKAGLEYLAARQDVESGRTGLLGLSTGADVALEAAAQYEEIAVVVADGATAQGFADRPSGWFTALSLGTMYGAGAMLTGESPLPPLRKAIRAIAPRPVLLIAGGSIPVEIPLNRGYAAAGGPTVGLWAIPDVAHTAALATLGDAYGTRVLGCLDSALVAEPGSVPPTATPCTLTPADD